MVASRVSSTWRSIFTIFGVLLLAFTGCARPTATEGQVRLLARHGLTVFAVSETNPLPQQWHVVKFDLATANAEVAVVLAPDPDGDGPVEALLTSPLKLARQANALAFINSSPWRLADGEEKSVLPGWHLGQKVVYCGLAATDGELRSSSNPPNYPGLWVDTDGKVQLGVPADTKRVRHGVGGFQWILRDGKSVGRPGGKRHPRTAVGMNREQETLFLVVVDGRQKGYSEGATTYELAAFFLRIGASDAINLDGGGSSILILADEEGGLDIQNRPSDQILGISRPRPLPSGLLIRQKQ